MFRTVPLSIIRSFSPYTQQWHMSYRFADSLRAGSGSRSEAVYKPVWHIPLPCVRWKTPDDEERNCPKHVEFHSKINLRNYCIYLDLIYVSMSKEYSCFRWEINCEISKTAVVSSKTSCLNESRTITTREVTLTTWHFPTQSLYANKWRSSRTKRVTEF